jgi:hypothetical protein
VALITQTRLHWHGSHWALGHWFGGHWYSLSETINTTTAPKSFLEGVGDMTSALNGSLEALDKAGEFNTSVSKAGVWTGS